MNSHNISDFIFTENSIGKVWQKTFAVISVFTFKGLKLTGLMEITSRLGILLKMEIVLSVRI